MIDVSIGVSDSLRDKGGDDLSEGKNDETDDGVEDGLFGFLELARVAGGSNVAPSADKNEDSGDDAGNSAEPANQVGDEVGAVGAVGINIGIFQTDTVIKSGGASDGDTDGAEDSVGRDDDSETDEGVDEGLFATHGFAGIAGGTHIKKASVHDVE